MSINNRKYIQSTGSLLTRLTEESNNPNFQQRDMMQQQQPQASFQQNVNMNYNRSQQQQQQQSHQQMSYQNSNYQSMPQQQYAASNNMYVNSNFNQTTNVPMNYPTGSLQPQAVAAAAQLINQITNSNQSQDLSMMSQHQAHQQQRRHQHHGSYNTSRDSKKPTDSRSHQKKQQQQQVSSSTVTELPETFGLPTNNKKYSSKQSDVKIVGIESEDLKVVVESKSSADIEIIGENYSENAKPDLIVSTSTAAPVQSKSTSDELFKSYLGRKFHGQLAVTSKPQSNFISNFSCISQLLTECDYYSQRQRKPYSNLKLRNFYTKNESENEAEETEEATNEMEPSSKKLKTKHVIVIDDTSEDMHKPWITPDLIKLIKHRNLLQSKLSENLDGAEPEQELLKKFKNLRNKVTKLVKKARKDYLTKYIADSKEMKKIEAEKTGVLEASLVASLAQQAPPPPPPLTTSQTNVASPLDAKSVSPDKPPVVEGVSTENQTAVAKITAQLLASKKEKVDIKSKDEIKSSFLKNQSTLMMGLYNQYYAQYIQQYQSQQEEAHKLAQAAAEHEKKMGGEEDEEIAEETKSSFELLQKQASYYAKQQASIQNQLEASLSQSANQLIEEISTMAAAQAQKPFVLNQFTHQQHHLHQHIHQQQNPITGYNPHTATSQQLPQQQQQQYLPQPIGNTISTAQPTYEPTPQQQQPSYNMHYNYNMVVS